MTPSRALDHVAARSASALVAGVLTLLLATASPVAAQQEQRERDDDGGLAGRVAQALGDEESAEPETEGEAEPDQADARDEDAADKDEVAETNADAEDGSSGQGGGERVDEQPVVEPQTPRLSPIFQSVSPTRRRAQRSAPAEVELAADENEDHADDDADRNGDANDASEGPEAAAEDASDADAAANDEDAAESTPAEPRRVVVERRDEARPRTRARAENEDIYRDYTIRQGDTFSSIAARVFDDEKKWTAIAQANPSVDPARLRVGQVIRLPDPERYEANRERQLARVAAAVARSRGNRPAENDEDDTNEDDARTVTVSSGDTLSHIAQRVYGRANLWRHIFDANRDQLNEPNDLQVGMRLRIPPSPD